MFKNCFQCGATVDYEVNQHSLCRCCGKRAFPTLLELIQIRGQWGDEPGAKLETITISEAYCAWDPAALASGLEF